MNIRTVIVLGLLMATMSLVVAEEKTISFGPYELTYTYSSEDSQAGERFTLYLTLENIEDSDRRNIEFSFDEDDPFNVIGDETWDIGDLEANASVEASFRIEIDEDTDTDEYDLAFTLSDDKKEYTEDIEIEVDSNTPEWTLGALESYPRMMAPDMENIELKVTLENTGGGDASFVKASLILPKGFQASESYSNVVSLGKIVSGEGKEAVFYIDTNADVKPGNYEAEIKITYEDPNGDALSKTLSLDLPLKGIPLFSLKGEVATSFITSGTEDAQVRVIVRNNGEVEGKETSLRIIESGDNPFSFHEKTRRIGSLAKGESGSAIFSFDVDSDAFANTYLVKVEVRTVSGNNVLVSEETISIPVEKKPETNYLRLSFIALLVILVGLLVLLLMRRR